MVILALPFRPLYSNISLLYFLYNTIQSVSPGFRFIRMFIMIYLFVLDDSLTS